MTNQTVEVRVKKTFKRFRFGSPSHLQHSSTFYVETDRPGAIEITTYKKGEKAVLELRERHRLRMFDGAKEGWKMSEEELWMLKRDGLIELTWN